MDNSEIPSLSSSCSDFVPVCCKEHRLLCCKRKHLDVSRWKLVDDPIVLHPRKFDAFSRKTPSGQSRAKGMKELNVELDKVRKNVLLDLAASTTNEASIKDDLEQHELIEAKPVEPNADSSKDSSCLKQEGILQKYKKKDVKTNPYLNLLNRLDEIEGKRAPSVEDKLKLAEDHLRVSTIEFCRQSSILASINDKDHHSMDLKQADMFIHPDIMQKLFCPKIFYQSPCPLIPFTAKKMKGQPLLIDSKTKSQQVCRKKEKTYREKIKQSYYLPVNTWFAPTKKEDAYVSPEELELLNSFSAKELLKYLEERKREPPKVLTELQERIAQEKLELKEKARRKTHRKYE